MPLYEYKCRHCAREREVLQKVGDAPPVCDRKPEHGPMTKKVSKSRFKLVGGGWAASGYGG